MRLAIDARNAMKIARFALSAALATLLAGCAALNTITSEVSTYGEWPADRAPGTYVIERLPSQQTAASAKEQAPLEDGARKALEAAGFRPAADKAAADVVVQIGARVTRFDRSPWDDPLWWGFYGPRWAGPAWVGPGPSPFWSWRTRTFPADRTDYLREVGVLVRDRASGQPLYEARARTDGITNGGTPVLNAMFTAALKEFPKVQNEPHDVSVLLP
jgi:Domain of unknown function (DUF4136)